MMRQSGHHKFAAPLAMGTVLAVAMAILAFRHHDLHGENYYYWMFARVLAETGTFPVNDRSPLTALYLQPFLHLPYPAGAIADYLLRAVLAIAGFAFLLRRSHGLALGAFAGALWSVFLEDAAPLGQELGLLAVMLAAGLRRADQPLRRIGWCYALLVTAWMFRPTYAAAIPLFALHDAIVLFRGGRPALAQALSVRHAAAIVAPLLLVAAAFGWFGSAKWQHPYNNAYAGPAQWYPLANPGSLADANFVSALANLRMRQAYGTLTTQDWWLERDGILAGIRTYSDAVKAEPLLLVGDVAENLPVFAKTILSMTLVPRAVEIAPLAVFSTASLALLIVLGALLHAWRSSANGLFPVLVVLTAAATALPKVLAAAEGWRHYGGFVPVFVFAGLWVGHGLWQGIAHRKWDRLLLLTIALALVTFIIDKVWAWQLGLRSFPLLQLAALTVVAAGVVGLARLPSVALRFGRGLAFALPAFGLLVLAQPALEWTQGAREVATDLRTGTLRAMDGREPWAPRRHMAAFAPRLAECRGFMALDHQLWAAFGTLPIDRVYSPLEIPPFGRLGDSPYDGLNPDRVDCLLVSDTLRETRPAAINVKVRWENYVKPYADYLVAHGAKKYDLDGYGSLYQLNKARER